VLKTGDAGALADLINGRKLQNKIKATLIESSNRLLPEWNPRSSKITEDLLKEKGTSVMLNNLVSEVGKKIVRLNSGIKISSSLTVWTAGTGGNKINCDPEIEKTNDERIIVNSFCRNSKYKNIFAISDSSAMYDEDEKLHPQLAQLALRQAKYLARILVRYIFNDLEPKETFKYKTKVRMVLLGKTDYVGKFIDYVLSGHIGRVTEDLAKLFENIEIENVIIVVVVMVVVVVVLVVNDYFSFSFPLLSFYNIEQFTKLSLALDLL
jgi:NADH:ubiquinone reductase (H+-translocating)